MPERALRRCASDCADRLRSFSDVWEYAFSSHANRARDNHGAAGIEENRTG